MMKTLQAFKSWLVRSRCNCAKGQLRGPQESHASISAAANTTVMFLCARVGGASADHRPSSPPGSSLPHAGLFSTPCFYICGEGCSKPFWPMTLRLFLGWANSEVPPCHPTHSGGTNCISLTVLQNIIYVGPHRALGTTWLCQRQEEARKGSLWSPSPIGRS